MTTDIKIRWLLEVVDQGAGSKLLAQDQELRRSLEQTDLQYKRLGGEASRAASEQVAATQEAITASQRQYASLAKVAPQFVPTAAASRQAGAAAGASYSEGFKAGARGLTLPTRLATATAVTGASGAAQRRIEAQELAAIEQLAARQARQQPQKPALLEAQAAQEIEAARALAARQATRGAPVAGLAALPPQAEVEEEAERKAEATRAANRERRQREARRAPTAITVATQVESASLAEATVATDTAAGALVKYIDTQRTELGIGSLLTASLNAQAGAYSRLAASTRRAASGGKVFTPPVVGKPALGKLAPIAEATPQMLSPYRVMGKAGTDVGGQGALPGEFTAEQRAKVRAAAAAVGSAVSPGLGVLPIRSMEGELGRQMMVRGSPKLGINTRELDQVGLGRVMQTIAHETGHYVDRFMLGAGQHWDNMSRGLLEKMSTSPTLQRIAGLPEFLLSKAQKQYMLRPTEIYARGFAQRVAETGGERLAPMRAELRRAQSEGNLEVFQPGELERTGIAKEIDEHIARIRTATAETIAQAKASDEAAGALEREAIAAKEASASLSRVSSTVPQMKTVGQFGTVGKAVAYPSREAAIADQYRDLTEANRVRAEREIASLPQTLGREQQMTAGMRAHYKLPPLSAGATMRDLRAEEADRLRREAEMAASPLGREVEQMMKASEARMRAHYMAPPQMRTVSQFGPGRATFGRAAGEQFGRLAAPGGGFTISPLTGAEARRGYAVSMPPSLGRQFSYGDFFGPGGQLSFTGQEAVTRYVSQNQNLFRKRGMYVGGWHDPESGKLFLDPSQVVRDRERAIALAKARDQKAIFDLQRGVEIPTGGTGGVPQMRGMRAFDQALRASAITTTGFDAKLREAATTTTAFDARLRQATTTGTRRSFLREAAADVRPESVPQMRTFGQFGTPISTEAHQVAGRALVEEQARMASEAAERNRALSAAGVSPMRELEKATTATAAATTSLADAQKAVTTTGSALTATARSTTSTFVRQAEAASADAVAQERLGKVPQMRAIETTAFGKQAVTTTTSTLEARMKREALVAKTAAGQIDKSDEQIGRASQAMAGQVARAAEVGSAAFARLARAGKVAAAEMAGAAGGIKGAFGTLASSGKSVLGGLAGLAVTTGKVVGGGLVAAGGLAFLGLKRGGEISKEAAGVQGLTGVTPQTAISLSVLANALGIQTRSLGQGFGALGKQVEGLGKGTKASVEAFQKIQMSPAQVSALRNNLPKLFDEIYKRLGRLPQAERAGVAKQLLGRGAQFAGEVEAGGPLAPQIARLNKELGGVDPKRLENLHKVELELKEATIGLELTFAETFGPTLVKLLQGTAALMKPVGDAMKAAFELPLNWVKDNWPQIKGIAKDVASGVEEAFGQIKRTISGEQPKGRPPPVTSTEPHRRRHGALTTEFRTPITAGTGQVPLLQEFPGFGGAPGANINVGPRRGGLGGRGATGGGFAQQTGAGLPAELTTWQKIGKTAGEALQTIGSEAQKAGKELIEAFAPAKPFFENDLVKAVLAFAKGLGLAFTITLPVIKVAAAALGQLAGVLAKLPGPTNAVSTGLGILAAGPLLKLLADKTGRLGFVFTLLRAPLLAAGLGLRGFGAVLKGAGDLIERLPLRWSGAFSKGLKGVGGAASKIGDLFSGTLPGKGATKAGEDAAKNVESGFAKHLPAEKSLGERWASTVFEGMAGLLGKIRGLLGKIPGIPAPGVPGGKPVEKGAAGAATKEAEAAAKTAGESAGGGFIAGWLARLGSISLVRVLFTRILPFAALAAIGVEFGKQLADVIGKGFSAVTRIRAPRVVAIEQIVAEVKRLPGQIASVASDAARATARIAVSIAGGLAGLVGKLASIGARAGGAIIGQLSGFVDDALRVGARIATGAFRGLTGLIGKAASVAARAGGALIGQVASWAGEAAHQAARVPGRVGRALGGLVGAVSGVVSHVFTAAVGLGKSIVGGIVSGLGDLASKIGSVITEGVEKLPFGGKVLKALGLRRRGGRVSRHQHGGLVPSLVSPGEEVIYGSAGFIIPGPREAADSVPAMLPVGAAVITGHGQELMASGASINEAVAMQRPHFAGGGFVSTAYGPPWGGEQGGGSTFTGIDLHNAPHIYLVAVDPRVIALHSKLRIQPNPFSTHNPFAAEDTGGAIKGNRIDFYDWRGRASQNAWGRRSVNVQVVGHGGSVAGVRSLSPSAAGGATVSVPIRLGPSRTREGLVEDVTGAGEISTQESQAALRGVRGARRSPVLGQIAEGVGELTKQITLAGPSAPKRTAGRRTTGRGSFDPKQLTTFDGIRVAAWIAQELQYARAHGWSGHITSGYRPGRDPHTATGTSEHQLDVYPGGAVDFGGMADPVGLANRTAFEKAARGYRGSRLVRPRGFRDDGHMSGTGHRRGGFIGFQHGGRARRRRPVHYSSPLGTAFPLGAAFQPFPAAEATGNKEVIEEAAGRIEGVLSGYVSNYLNTLRAKFVALVRKGGTAQMVKAWQAVVSMIDDQLNKRIVEHTQVVERLAKQQERHAGQAERDLRRRGIDPTSALGLGEQIKSDVDTQQIRLAQREEATKAVREARKTGNKKLIEEANDRMLQARDELDEAMVKHAEDVRARIKQQAVEVAEAGQFAVEFQQGQVAGQEIGERLAGTTESVGAKERKARTLWTQVVPAAQEHQRALEYQRNVLQNVGASAAELRPVILGIQAAANEVGAAFAEAAELIRQAAIQAAQEVTEGTTYEVGKEQRGLTTLELKERLANTYEGAGAERAAYITQHVIPAMERDIAAKQHEAQVLAQQEPTNVKQARAIAEAIGTEQNGILEEQLKAQEEVAKNTARKIGGTLGFTYGGENLNDELIGVGSGA